MISFSIIPSLTDDWYIRTENDLTAEIRPNLKPVLNVAQALAFSMACVVLASAFLVVRFSERCVQKMTLASIGFLTLHGQCLYHLVLCIYLISHSDAIIIPVITIFGVLHRFDDGFTYGQSFWFTVCSTFVSVATNIALIVDYMTTRDFAMSGGYIINPPPHMLKPSFRQWPNAKAEIPRYRRHGPLVLYFFWVIYRVETARYPIPECSLLLCCLDRNHR